MTDPDMADQSLVWPPEAATTIWPAPAKLNLFLHITGRRADGYHLLQTVFQILDYGDEMAFVPRADKTIRLVNQIDGVAENENLIWRAADLLKKSVAENISALPENYGVDIFLKKVLPMGGGLGGGSSNAATTLVALNHLWGLNYPVEKLADIGLTLGADVPVFVCGHSAWGEGVGEKLQPLTLPDRWYVVIHPDVHISTAELFEHSELTRDCTPITIRGFGSGSATRNVFEPLVCKQQPKVKEVLKLLFDYGTQASNPETDKPVIRPRLTGTGSCVFLECETETQAQNVHRAIAKDCGGCLNGFIARGVNESPLFRVV